MSARQSVIVHQGIVRPAENVPGFLMHAQPEALVDFSLAREVTWQLAVLGVVGTADSWIMRGRFQVGQWDTTAENFSVPEWAGLQPEQITAMIAEQVDWYGGAAVQQVWTNHVTNPSVAFSTTGWSAQSVAGVSGWAPARVPGAGWLNRHAYRGTATGTATAAGGGPAYVHPILADTLYSYGIGYRATVAAGTQRVRVNLAYFPNADGTGTQIGSTSFSNTTIVTSGVKNYLTFEAQTSPALAASVRISVTPISGTGYNPWADGDTWEGSAIMVTTAAALRPVSYFDGFTPGAVWTGTPGSSSSTLTFKPVASNLDPQPLLVKRTLRNFGALARVHLQPFAVNASTDFGVKYSLTATYELT